MIPGIEKVTLTKAKYTKLFSDISQDSKNEISTLCNTLQVPQGAIGLNDMLYNMYRYHEINDSDEEVFVQCVKDTFNEHIDYYKKLIEIYSNDITFNDILKKTTERNDTSDTSSSSTGTSTGENTTREYDLPNKQINPSSEDGYLTGKTKTNNEGTVTGSETRNNEYGSTITSKDNKEFIRVKNEYLAQIRNIVREFASRFDDCFLKVY